ncbi:MAG: GH92 family glycosyl hydrolase [Ginsengibacter sp.]
MKNIFLWIIIMLIFKMDSFAQENLIPYVNPMIGTKDMGHTYPGATVPFGMVQLSPDTDTIPYSVNGKYNPEVYRYCSGYQYNDKTIVGFGHTHFNGTGHSDLGDFLIMPTVGELKLNPGTADHPESGFRSRFSHNTEVAEPNYYKVKLEDYNINAELTTSERVGFHQYTFPATDQAHIILDMMYGIYNYPGKNLWSSVKVINDTMVVGYRQTTGFARNRILYFAMVFNKPFRDYGMRNFSNQGPYRGFWWKIDQTKDFQQMEGRQIRCHFDFDTKEGEQIKIKVAISAVSIPGAINNLFSEVPGWNFEQVKKRGQEKWNQELNKIVIHTPDEKLKESFYTSMYHAFINPTLYCDVDGSYRGLDNQIHQSDEFSNYSTFSLWDTFRALHPLFNIIQPRRNSDMVESMLAHYRQNPVHMLPVWSFAGNETWCMIGYHSVSVVADAIINGIDKRLDLVADQALDACIKTASARWYGGLGDYIDKGYVPSGVTTSSVSQTLEYAYDDWCIAQLAKKLNRMDVYQEFMKRSQNYKNVYDPSVGFMRPKTSDGSWGKNFDPLETDEPGFVEGNSWNYSLFVPQDPEEMIRMMGGKKEFAVRLDSLFTMHLPDKYFEHTEDISRAGIIGNYVHGNEPSHHVAYLYNWTDQPWKTQKWVRYILQNQYHPGPEGLGGNDDTGQMSAWYIFSELGFYPVAPGSLNYELGSPGIVNATLTLENGKTFTVNTKNQSDKNVYVEKVVLNGKVLNRKYITHDEIMNGGQIQFFMSAKPKKK